ncbi:MAG TPA: hypothetical protein DC057_05095 [Spirochaetia bacterium]|nr:hypothetical protein [Spirochaetia bacterium]
MSIITGKIDLSQLKHVLMEKKGKTEMVEGIFIPLKVNDLFKGKNGNIYMDIIAFDSVNEEYKQTHAVKQSFPKDKYTKEELSAKPFLGHLNTEFGGAREPKPNNVAPGTVITEAQDLPF